MDRSTFDSDLQALLAAASSRIPAHSLPDLPCIPGIPGDRDVGGHCVCTLYKMGAAGYDTEIAPFLTHEKKWVSDYAKRYMQQYGKLHD